MKKIFANPEKIEVTEKSYFPNKATGQLFGAAIRGGKISNRFIVGGFLSAAQNGEAYIFKVNNKSELELEFRFEVSKEGVQEAGDAWFGRDVAIYNNLAIAGGVKSEAIPPAGNSDGAAWVLRYNTTTKNWEADQRLQSDSPADGAEFGRAVTIAEDPNGNFTAIGDTNGKLHIFRESGGTWSFEKSITKSGFASFNGRLDAQTGMILAGAIGEGVGGKAFVLEDPNGAGTWTEKELVPSPAVPSGSNFGTRVNIHGDLAVVSATSEGPSGVAYIFRRKNGVWKQEARLFDNLTAGEQFGWQLGIRDLGNGEGIAAIGSNGQPQIRLYEKSKGEGWKLQGRIEPKGDISGLAFGDHFGMTRFLLASGAPLDDTLASDAGRVIAWKIPREKKGIPNTKIPVDAPTVTLNGVVQTDNIIVNNDNRTIVNTANPNIEGPVTINMTSSAPDAEIRYTFNGKNPTTSSTLFEEPFVIRENGNGFSSDNTILKAKTFSRGDSSPLTVIKFKII